jgi:hypothetical protein
MSKDRGSNLGQVKKRNSNTIEILKFKMGIASVTAISCGHMLHYIKLCLWGATILLMLSLISHMSTVALWSATRVAMPKVPGSKLGRTNSIFDKLNLKSFPSWWKLKIGGKLVTHDCKFVNCNYGYIYSLYIFCCWEGSMCSKTCQKSLSTYDIIGIVSTFIVLIS